MSTTASGDESSSNGNKVQQRRPLSTFQQQRASVSQQPLQQQNQKFFHSVIDPTFGLPGTSPVTSSALIPVATPTVALATSPPATALEEADAVVSSAAAEQTGASVLAEMSPPDSQLDSRSFDSLTAGQLDGDADVEPNDGDGLGEVERAVEATEGGQADDGEAAADAAVQQSGGGGGASSDEGLISGEEEDAADYVDEHQGPSGSAVSRGTFRRKFEASLRKKAAADSAEQDRRRCASMAAAIAATTSATEEGDVKPSGVGSVALRSEEVRRRIESTVIQVARSSSIAGDAPGPAVTAGASQTPNLVRSDSKPPTIRSSFSTGSTPATAATPVPVSATTLPSASPISAGWRVEGGGPSGDQRVFLFGEPSMSLGYLAAGATEQQQQPPKSARPEISLPIGHIQETRKEGVIKLTKISGPSGKQQQSSSGSGGSKKSSHPAQPQLYRLLLTGPDLLFYRHDKKTSEKKPEFALNVAATEILSASDANAAASDDAETDMRLRYPIGGAGGEAVAPSDASLSRYSHLYPNGGSFEYLLHWDDPKQRKEWSVALRYAKDLLMQRMYGRTAGPPIDWSYRRVSIAQRLNDFFRRRPALNELVDRGIVRNEPVFGSTLRLICQHERSDVPNFLRRCLLAIESHGLDTEGIYRLAGNAATVQKLRLMVDQQEDYDLTSGWDIHVLTSALKTFLRELKEPVIPSDTFQAISNHFRSAEKPSVKREAIRQALRSLPAYNYASLRLLCEHLSKVVSQSEQSQMNSRNLALMFGPNLVLPDAAGAGLCPTSNLMYQNQVVEYILLESEKLFND